MPTMLQTHCKNHQNNRIQNLYNNSHSICLRWWRTDRLRLRPLIVRFGSILSRFGANASVDERFSGTTTLADCDNNGLDTPAKVAANNGC